MLQSLLRIRYHVFPYCSIKLNLHRRTFFIKVKKHANIVSKTRMSLKISKTKKLPDKIVSIFNFSPISHPKMQILFLKTRVSLLTDNKYIFFILLKPTHFTISSIFFNFYLLKNNTHVAAMFCVTIQNSRY